MTVLQIVRILCYTHTHTCLCMQKKSIVKYTAASAEGYLEKKKKTLQYSIIYIMFIHILCSRVGTRYIILCAVLLTYFSILYWLADNPPPTLSRTRVSNMYKYYKISVCIVHTAHTYKLIYHIIYIFLVYDITPCRFCSFVIAYLKTSLICI